MNPSEGLPPAKDKTLFTPGPLTTSLSVKQAMLHDSGSWHFEFNSIVHEIREKILALAGVSRETGYETILMQGSGTFGVESVLVTCLPPNGKLLVLANGAYGERIVLMAERANIPHTVLRAPEDRLPDLRELDRTLTQDKAITHVAAVHCETTTGILNPIKEIGRLVREHACSYIVDAMSSFAAIPIDIPGAAIDYLVSSPNKCIEGVPGFSFVIARRKQLLADAQNPASLSLDLLDQLKSFEKNGQFRYTPPTHSILAFRQALKELDDEGGIPARAARYQRNHELLVQGMKQLGFRLYLPPQLQSYIITAFHMPETPNFTFQEFYHKLSDKGFIIYPGKLTQVNCFRIGSIGRIFEADIRALLGAIRETIGEMGLCLQPGDHELNPAF